MGRAQPHRSQSARASDFRGAPCLCFVHPAGPAGQKRHSQPVRARKSSAEKLCAELWRAHDFGLAQVFVPSGAQCRTKTSLRLSPT